MDKKDDLFDAAIDAGKAEGATSGLGKKARKAEAKVAKVEQAAGADAGVFNRIMGAKPPKAQDKGPQKKSDASRDAENVVFYRDQIARMGELFEENPERYGEIPMPDMSARLTAAQLKEIYGGLYKKMQESSGRQNFADTWNMLPSMIEGMSLRGDLPLNLVGLSDELVDETKQTRRLDPREQWAALGKELAISLDRYFAISPFMSAAGLLVSTVYRVHTNNMKIVSRTRDFRGTEQDQPSPDVQPE